MALAFALSRVPPVPSVIGGAFNACRTIFTRPQMPIRPNQGTVSAPVFGVCGATAGAGGPWAGSLLSPWIGLIGAVSGRTNIRNHFPRPSEVKRIKRHGWKARMATLAGRRVLMRRILKGRHVYSH